MSKEKTIISPNDPIEKGFSSYIALLQQIKHRVIVAQKRAIYAANEEVLRMYWDIGELLERNQVLDGWGKKTLQRLSTDLKNEYPEIKGFTVRNLQYMVQFYKEYDQSLTKVKSSENKNTKPAVSQLSKPHITLPIKHLSWTHNLILLQRAKDIQARYWYMIQCITNHWSKDYLIESIKNNDFAKHGALANNFSQTLPSQEALEVKSLLKDPYIFDMLTFTEQYNERDIEIGLVKHVEKFLVEMGAGFAFMGRQYHIEVSGDDYYIDMLMYNTFLHRYMVIELKNTEFRPEYIGKLNFYCSAVDDILCREGDNRTIGLLLCKSKDRIKAEYALRDIQKPIGISDYELGQALPINYRSNLPTIEEIEEGLNQEPSLNVES